ncbi:phosphoglycerate dehydrogenase [Bosea sp. LjRoot9]|uniref:phosphoglycerate dehydrogenase n=1 Tax=Bosea sp. LjRoot9 TaxID=3342341 RepID=UPI003ECFF49F
MTLRTQRLSLSKDRIKVLLLEGINDSAADLMVQAGYTNMVRLPKALDHDALLKAVEGVHVLGIRSRTQLTEPVFAQASRLFAVGCFSVGTNQVDLQAARGRGVPVFNAPFSNTRSVAELTIGEIVMLLRKITDRSVSAHGGGWDKSANGSFEVRGKVLGIVGYGNIGSQLSTLAEAMGMRVIYFDQTDRLRHGNTEPVDSLAELLGNADIVSLHVPETPATAGMIGAEQIAQMRPGSYLINNSRGTVVDLEALAVALREGRLAGAAVDVFPVEPASNAERFVSPLQGLANVILTPHVGGSTEEAQERIGAEVARKLVDYSDIGSTVGAVNFPQVQLTPRPAGTRFIHVQRNVPGMLRRLNDVFAAREVNISAQNYQTDGEVGYVVMEADSVGPEARDILREIAALDGTIRARLLYQRA